MPEIYVCKIDLPQKRTALAYALREDNEDYIAMQSLIKIFKPQEEKPQHSIPLPGEVRAMNPLKKDLFAVTMDGADKIFVYSAEDGQLKETLPLRAIILASITTSKYLIASVAGGYLSIYNKGNLQADPQVIKTNGLVKSLTASEEFLFCDVSASNRIDSLSSIMRYDLRTGVFLNKIGADRAPTPIKESFLGVLNSTHIFLITFWPRYCELHVYPLDSEKPLKTIDIQNKKRLEVCALPRGGVAIYREEENNTVYIYHPLKSNQPKKITADFIDLEIKSSGDILAFVATHERGRLSAEIASTAVFLRTLSFFPEPVEKLITAYSLSSEALEESKMDDLVQSSWPKTVAPSL